MFISFKNSVPVHTEVSLVHLRQVEGGGGSSIVVWKTTWPTLPTPAAPVYTQYVTVFPWTNEERPQSGPTEISSVSVATEALVETDSPEEVYSLTEVDSNDEPAWLDVNAETSDEFSSESEDDPSVCSQQKDSSDVLACS